MAIVHASSTTSSPTTPSSATARGRLGALVNGRRRWLAALVGLALIPIAVVAWNGFSMLQAWNDLERETLDHSAFEDLAPLDASQLSLDELPELTESDATDGDTPPDQLAAAAGSEDSEGSENPDSSDNSENSEDPTFDDTLTIDDTLDDRYTTFMVVGSDKGDLRADVIVLVLLPNDGGKVQMVSLPRDLYLPNRCTRTLTRINANYNGCGSINGATLLSGAVKDFTGLTVDHFILFTMDGFAQIVDAVGGVEICVDNPVREQNKFHLPAGCSTVNGRTALGWVRSRRTQELVDGTWQTMRGVNDLSRNQRQQELILGLVERVSEFRTPGELTTFAASLSDHFVLDDQLSLSDAVDLAWSNKHIKPNQVHRFTIPVRNYTTSGGAQVLIPTSSFAEALADS